MSGEAAPVDAYGKEVAKAEVTKVVETKEPDPVNDPITYFGFGAVTLWGAILSFMVRNKYRGIPESNEWWKKNCPATAYTDANVKASYGCATETLTCPQPMFVKSFPTTGYVMGWLQSECLDAAPIK